MVCGVVSVVVVVLCHSGIVCVIGIACHDIAMMLLYVTWSGVDVVCVMW